MSDLATQKQYNPVFQEYGFVVNKDNEIFKVETQVGTYETKQAMSCLLEPEPGDRVLISGDSYHDCFILAVLERTQKKQQNINIKGDLNFIVQDGKLSIASKDGLKMASGKDISMISQEINIDSAKGKIGIHKLFFAGSLFQGQIARIKVAAGIFDSIVDRLTQKVKRSFRTIEDSDQVRAGRIDYVARKLLNFRGKYSILTAKKDIRMDGEHIHMG